MFGVRRIQSIGIAAVLAATCAMTMTTVTAQREGAASHPYATPPAEQLKRVEAKNGVVTSANGLASEAGLEMLRKGGNAVDAVVATAFAIGVVEPEMSGLGASGAAVVWMKRDGKPMYLDFYAAQPADSWRGHTTPARRPQQPEGQPPASGADQEPGSSLGTAPGDLRVVAIPGDVVGLLTLLEKFGKLSREQVMAPAIRLADEGFPVGQILAAFIESGRAKMKPFPKALDLYFPDGKPLAPGVTLKNADLAESLRRVAREGRRGYYEGPIAEALIATLNAGGHPATSWISCISAAMETSAVFGVPRPGHRVGRAAGDGDASPAHARTARAVQLEGTGSPDTLRASV